MNDAGMHARNETWVDRIGSVSTLAHELRQPLANLSCAAEILRCEPVSPAGMIAVEIIRRQARQMTRMVEDLLDEARWARGALSLRLQRLDLRTTIEEAALDARARAAQHGHELVVVTGHRPLWVEADADRIRQVLSNLIDNAIKSTDRGGRIRVTASHSGTHVVLQVEDTGHGLASSQLTQIFELFATARSTPAVGLGIGLTIVRDIVTLHRGTVEARSGGVGHGTAFRVMLPGGVSVDAAEPAARGAEPRGREDVALATAGWAVTVENPQSGGEHPAPSPGSDRASVVTIPPTGIPLEEVERQAVSEALRMSNWVQKRAAELLGITPRVMHYKIKVLSIETPRSRNRAALASTP